MKTLKIKIAILLLATAWTGTQAWAATVGSVKNKQVVLNMASGESLSVGQQLAIVDRSGKRTGIVRIRQVRGNRALAEIVRGTAATGSTTQAAAAARGGSTPARGSTPAASSSSKSRLGFFGGLAMNTMALTAQYQPPSLTLRSEDLNLKGNGFNFKAYYDYDYSKMLTIRAISGLETFSAKGSTAGASLICSDGTSNECEVNFNYLSLEGHVQFNYLNSGTRAWAGVGYSFLITMSKAINIPNLQATGSTNQMILFGTGADFKLGSGSYIPVAVEYGYIPGDNVKASAIYARAGYAFDF